MKKEVVKSSILFVILMGLIAMMCDMTHEGARSIYGSFLSEAGASPSTISLISGLGELVGTALIFVTGIIAGKTKRYWLMTIIGYGMNLICIPLLCLTMENGWIYACMLILLERIGRAIRKPARSTLVSFSSKNIGEGKAFAISEFLDQIGAFVGPLILSLVLVLDKNTNVFSSYKLCFLILGVPAVITMILLFIAKAKFPKPEDFEEDDLEEKKFKIDKSFTYYLIAIGFCAFGFIDFPLITLHLGNTNLFTAAQLPLLYSLAMLADAIAALIFGFLFDKYGIKILAISSLLSSFFAIFIFLNNSVWMIIVGVIIWGISMGAQESILKSAVAKIIDKKNRSIGFGVFEGFFGICWFLGSLTLGFIYENSLIVFIVISSVTQALAIPFFLVCAYMQKKTINKKSSV